MKDEEAIKDIVKSVHEKMLRDLLSREVQLSVNYLEEAAIAGLKLGRQQGWDARSAVYSSDEGTNSYKYETLKDFEKEINK